MVRDETKDVETEAIMRMEIVTLREALEQLDSDSYQLIHSLYLANTRKTLRQLSRERGIPVMTLQDRKRKILIWLREKLSGKFS